jgi:hypothetical protein
MFRIGHVWLTSLPAAVLVAGGLVLALLVAIGGRPAIRALVPAAERDAAYAIAAPLLPAFVIMVLTMIVVRTIGVILRGRAAGASISFQNLRLAR